MRQQHVTQRQNKQIMEGNELETERFPIRQETHTQRQAIPANFSYFTAFPTLRSNRRRQRERAHTLHIDVGTTTLPGSSLLLLPSPQSQQTAASPRQVQHRRRRYVLVFGFLFFGKNLKNSPSSSATKTKGKQIRKTPESPESSSSDSDASELPDALRH
jgi:hypothetical protein